MRTSLSRSISKLMSGEIRLIQVRFPGEAIHLEEVEMIKEKVVLCGSFNPLHHGHINLLGEAFLKSQAPSYEMCFELAIYNADKG